MVIQSLYPEIDIPQTDLLTYLFGSGENLPDTPVWINAADTSISLSARSAEQWVKRLGIGLDKLGVKRGEVVMHISPNHIYTAVAYLGTVGAGRVFSGANPIYTADGRSLFFLEFKVCALQDGAGFAWLCIQCLGISQCLVKVVALPALGRFPVLWCKNWAISKEKSVSEAHSLRQKWPSKCRTPTPVWSLSTPLYC